MIEPHLNAWFVDGPPIELMVSRCDRAESHPAQLFNIRPLAVGLRLKSTRKCGLRRGDYVEVSATHPQTGETLVVVGMIRRRGGGKLSGFLSIVFTDRLTPDPFPRETTLEELNRFLATETRQAN